MYRRDCVPMCLKTLQYVNDCEDKGSNGSWSKRHPEDKFYKNLSSKLFDLLNTINRCRMYEDCILFMTSGKIVLTPSVFAPIAD